MTCLQEHVLMTGGLLGCRIIGLLGLALLGGPTDNERPRSNRASLVVRVAKCLRNVGARRSDMVSCVVLTR